MFFFFVVSLRDGFMFLISYSNQFKNLSSGIGSSNLELESQTQRISIDFDDLMWH